MARKCKQADAAAHALDYISEYHIVTISISLTNDANGLIMILMSVLGVVLTLS